MEQVLLLCLTIRCKMQDLEAYFSSNSQPLLAVLKFQIEVYYQVDNLVWLLHFLNNIVGLELTLSSLFKINQWYNLTNHGPLICEVAHLYKYSAVIKD